MQINLARCRILCQKSNEDWRYNKLSIQGSKNIFFKVKIFSNRINAELAKSLIKVNVIFAGIFIKPQSGETSYKFFTTKNKSIDKNTNLNEWYKLQIVDTILNDLEEFQERDSGWALSEILYIKININSYNPINVGISTLC
jgi:hypothetical protein